MLFYIGVVGLRSELGRTLCMGKHTCWEAHPRNPEDSSESQSIEYSLDIENAKEQHMTHEATGGRSLILHQALLIGKKWLQLLLLVCFPPLLL